MIGMMTVPRAALSGFRSDMTVVILGDVHTRAENVLRVLTEGGLLAGTGYAAKLAWFSWAIWYTARETGRIGGYGVLRLHP